MTARQIIIHAGFHKTGTSTVQATLQANGKRIWPSHALVLPKRIEEVTRMATLHSVTGGPVSLGEFKDRMLAFLGTLQLGAKRGLILSAENLSGLIPGRRGHLDYAACPDLMAATEACLSETWGDDLNVTFVFGVRERQAWLRSAYWQNLRSSRLTQDFDGFAAPLEGVSLEGTVAQVRAALKAAQVRMIALEDARDLAFGPATLILEMAALRAEHRAELVARPVGNRSPDQATIAACLALNRSGGSDAQVATRKEALLRSVQPVSNVSKIA